MYDPESPNSQSGGPKYFDALESLCVTGSLYLIQRLLDFIDSPYLKSIEVYPVTVYSRSESQAEPADLFTASMTIVAFKWSQFLKNLAIGTTQTTVTPRLALQYRNA